MDIYEFIMPDEMVMQAVETACSFFDLPEAPVINSDGVCVRENIQVRHSMMFSDFRFRQYRRRYRCFQVN